MNDEARRRRLLWWGGALVVLLTLAAAAVLFLWERVLFGLRAAGVATALFLLSPPVLAHGRLATVDATGIAIAQDLGSKVAPIVNTVMLGAFVTATKEVELKDVVASMGEHVPFKAEENAAACEEAARSVKLHW